MQSNMPVIGVYTEFGTDPVWMKNGLNGQRLKYDWNEIRDFHDFRVFWCMTLRNGKNDFYENHEPREPLSPQILSLTVP